MPKATFSGDFCRIQHYGITLLLYYLFALASDMIETYQAENSFGDVSNKVVADFGCGCGTLGAAAALLDAE